MSNNLLNFSLHGINLYYTPLPCNKKPLYNKAFKPIFLFIIKLLLFPIDIFFYFFYSKNTLKTLSHL